MVTLLRERMTGFRGGMNDSAATADDFAAEQCEYISNARIDRDGGLVCRLGSQLLKNGPIGTSGTGRMITPFRTAAGTIQLMAGGPNPTTGNVGVFRSTDGGATWTFIANVNEPAVAGYFSYCTYNDGVTNWLIMANGADMYSWDGTSLVLVTGPVADVKYVATFNERIWASDGKALYASKIRDHTVWTAPDGIVLRINTHDGDEQIKNVASAGQVLLVQKRYSTSWVDGFGNSDVIAATGAQGLSGSTGCFCFRTFQKVGDAGYMWLSERGIEFWAGVGAQIQPVALGVRRLIDNYRPSMAITQPDVSFGLYYPLNNEYWLKLFNSFGVAVHLDHKFGVTRIDDWSQQAISCACIADINSATVPNQLAKPVGLSASSTPIIMEYGTTHKGFDGASPTAIPMVIRSRRFDFREPFRRKRGRLIRVAGVETVDQTATCALIADGVLSSGVALPQHNLALTIAPTDHGTGFTGNVPSAKLPARVNKRGVTLQVEIRGTGGLKVSALELEAELQLGTF